MISKYKIKSLVLTLSFIFLYVSSYGQKITIENLIECSKINATQVSNYLLEKGFRYAGKSNNIDTLNPKSIRYQWVNKTTNFMNLPSEWIFKYDTLINGNHDPSIQYVIYSKSNYTSLIASIFKNKFKLIKTEEYKGELISRYSNRYYNIVMFRMADGGWDILLNRN